MDVVISGEIETEQDGLAYGAMVFKVAPGTTTEPHRHASEETWAVQSGAGYCLVDGERIGLIPGSRVVAPPHSEHTITNDGSEDLVVLSMWWKKL
ncbi:cupin domain-containing protein [Streptomyces cinerochromogenes]|uniref:cupin domain-containing protein n=1 Tax=Streptomyces cinerochromogenes TaxID=66422 RepID=UPI0033AA9B5A